ncbi:MAG: SDR family oxidoreductase [bacterium]|nr:SDR family oxidoreductase [bacterium]
MRILILGAAGMLGHKLTQHYRDRCDLRVTVRGGADSLARYDLIDPACVIGGVDAFNFDSVINAFAQARPDVVVNCIGVIKQLAAAKDPVISLTINSLLPHKLAQLCSASGARLIHISTDCVFSGRKGMYTEADVSDAEDLYGRTKFLGEVDAPHLTLRTSIIGRELNSASGLIEWFLTNRGKTIRGYMKAIYSGFTTQAMTRILASVIEDYPDLQGVYQVSSEPINKAALLGLVDTAFRTGTTILPEYSVSIDRSLDSTRFREATGFTPQPWWEMIDELAADKTPYDEWKSK